MSREWRATGREQATQSELAGTSDEQPVASINPNGIACARLKTRYPRLTSLDPHSTHPYALTSIGRRKT